MFRGHDRSSLSRRDCPQSDSRHAPIGHWRAGRFRDFVQKAESRVVARQSASRIRQFPVEKTGLDMNSEGVTTTAAWAFEVFYDGECPLCRREIAWLRWLDRRARLRFTDISAHGFSASELGLSHGDLMAEIRGRFPDGRIVRGVEVFRQLYAAVGLGLPVALTRLPLVRHVLDAAYRVFARNRLKLTGRCTDACRIGGPP